MTEKTDRATYTVTEIAQILGIGRNQAYAAVKSGHIRSVRIGGRILVPRTAIESLLNAEERGPATA